MKRHSFVLFSIVLLLFLAANTVAEERISNDVSIESNEPEAVVSEFTDSLIDLEGISQIEADASSSNNAVAVSKNESGSISIDSLTFPDKNFRKYVLDVMDLNGDSFLSSKERTRVKGIHLGNVWRIDEDGDDVLAFSGHCDECGEVEYKIKTLKGIEYFPNLKYLHCFNIQLKYLDVSNNTQLRSLVCFNNKLTELDVSKNVDLYYLNCKDNNIKKLKLGKNKKLNILVCSNNTLKSIDLTNCSVLKKYSKYSDSYHFEFDYGKTKVVIGGKTVYGTSTNYKPLNYDYAERNPKSYKGKKIYFDGEIVQVIEKGSKIVFRIAENGDDDYIMWCTYKKPKNYARFLEGDWVRIYGKSTGLTTYRSVWGNKITIPSCSVNCIRWNYAYWDDVYPPYTL